MSQNSKIEWTNKTWNPVTGCTKVSQGCKNCYAERMYERFNGKGTFKNVTCHDDRLLQPLRWRKPYMVFVNSMSDIFHEAVPFEFVRKVFGVMAVCQDHTFQILTKRPERMADFFKWMNDTDPDFQNDPADEIYNLCIEAGIETGCGSAFVTDEWPLKNVWLGVSVEDQKAADERIPILRDVPAAVRFISCEPMLGPIDLINLCDGKIDAFNPGVQWVICGGESGPGARPMHPDWARSLRNQCANAGVPFFFKQWGEWYPLGDRITNGTKYRLAKSATLDGGKKGYTEMYRVGKKRAGRVLDDVMHNQFPNA